MSQVRYFFGRHFTWVSATIVAALTMVTFILIILYVPAAQKNAVIRTVLRAGALAFGVVTLLGSVLTIHDWWEKRGLDLPVSGKPEEADEGLSTPAQGFVETEEELMERAMEELDGWFTVRENHGILLDPEPDMNGVDREAMLYVFAAQVAADVGERDSPNVSKQEIMDEMDLSTRAAGVFMNKMADFIAWGYDPSVSTSDEDVMFQLNKHRAPEVAEYIKGNRASPN